MTLIISRNSQNGDSKLARIPFAEPGPQPQLRISALTFQGNSGEGVSNIALADGNMSIDNGVGDAPTYRIPSSGVPGIRFNPSDDANAANKFRPTLFKSASSSRPAIKTLSVTFRVYSFPTSAWSNDRNSYGHFVGTTWGGAETIFMTGTSNPNYPAGCIFAYAGSAGSFTGYGRVSADGRLHTATYVFDSTASLGRLYLDGKFIASSSATPFTSNGIISGLTYSGGDWDVLEAATYADALTASQIMTKHEHYEALYQFQA